MPKTTPDPKLQSLREQGCLNSRPQSVSDELFTDNEFFDARDMVQVKYEMLRRVEKDGYPISEAAVSFGFSRPTFYQAQAALAWRVASRAWSRASAVRDRPTSSRPRSSDSLSRPVGKTPSLKTQDLVDRILERFDLLVHPRTIERALARTQKKR